MSNINLTLSDRLQQFAESQARAQGLAGGAAEYIVWLVSREERKRTDMEQIESSLQQAIEARGGGVMIDVNDHYWERKRQNLLARHRARDVAPGQIPVSGSGGKP